MLFVFTTYTYIISSATLYFFYIDSSIFVKILEFDTIFGLICL